LSPALHRIGQQSVQDIVQKMCVHLSPSANPSPVPWRAWLSVNEPSEWSSTGIGEPGSQGVDGTVQSMMGRLDKGHSVVEGYF
jgi:hypothetical protein